jgi:hypothetical protein
MKTMPGSLLFGIPNMLMVGNPGNILGPDRINPCYLSDRTPFPYALGQATPSLLAVGAILYLLFGQRRRVA